MMPALREGTAGKRNGPIHIIGTILGHVDSSKG